MPRIGCTGDDEYNVLESLVWALEYMKKSRKEAIKSIESRNEMLYDNP